MLLSGRVPGDRPNPGSNPVTISESLIHPHRGPRRGPTLTADNVLHHLVPVLHPNLAPLARGVQIAGQDDHRCQAAQCLLRAASRDPQQLLLFFGCQAAQDCLTKDVTCQVGKVTLRMA